jgi:hypothetical protein
MHNPHLIQFNNDPHTKDAVLEFIYSWIDTKALKRVYSGGDTSAFKEARGLIEEAFYDLSKEYEIKPRKSDTGTSR